MNNKTSLLLNDFKLIRDKLAHLEDSYNDFYQLMKQGMLVDNKIIEEDSMISLKGKVSNVSNEILFDVIPDINHGGE